MKRTQTCALTLLTHTPGAILWNCLVTALLLCTAPLAHSDDQPQPLKLDRPLQVAYTEFPPFSYTDTDGITRGYAVGIFKLLMDDLQLPYELKSRPTARIYHQLKIGELDIWLGPRGVPTLAPHVWEVPIPDAYSVNLYLWRKVGTPEAVDVSDLQHQNLVVINGFTYSGLIDQLSAPENNIQLFRTSSHSNALKMLVSGRSDYLLDYGRPIEILLDEHPEVTLLKTLMQQRKLAFVVSQKAQHAREVYERLLASGEHIYPTLTP